jgi:ribosomal protein L11 methyltransferase
VTLGLFRVAVRVPAHELEPARARMLELAPEGFEEVHVGLEVDLVAYAHEAALAALRSAFPQAVTAPVEPGWEDAWRAFHRPVVAGGVWIGPPWEHVPAGVAAVVIDPGRAFGTGAHPTTRLCAELLAGVERGSLLDVGCGSGVLAMVGARLGFGPLAAVDSDPVAAEVARANASANGIGVEVSVVDAAVCSLPEADVAVANIALDAVEAVLQRLSAQDALTSGYLEGERPAAPGWEHVRTLALDGWAADHFRHLTA